MAQHHFVVLIDQTSWRVAHFASGQFLELRSFSPVDDDLTAWLHWFQQFPRAAISVLSNLADEHYHVETLPHVRGSTGRQLLMRKVNAWPCAQGLHAIVRLDSVRTLRREDRFLFAALANPRLTSWLSRLTPPLPHIQGVYTQALCMPSWLPKLPPGIVHRLCIQCTKQQVRISYFQQKRLFFSRLISFSQTTFASLDERVNRIAQESGQLRLTFIQQRWMQEPDVFEVMWLGEVPHELDLVKKYLPSGSVWTCLSMPELQHQLGYKRVPDGMDVMDWAAMQPVLDDHALPNLAPSQVLLTNSMIRIKRKMHWAGAVMAGCMLLAGYVGVQVTQHSYLKVHTLSQQLAGLKPVKPYSDIRPDELTRIRALTQTVQMVQSALRVPDHAMTMLQQPLEGMQHWQLISVEWHCDSLNDQATGDSRPNTLSGCQETLTASWSTVALSDEAITEWQKIISGLKRHPAIAQVEVVSASESGAVAGAAAPRQGNTHQRVSMTPILKLHLRSTLSTSTI